MRVNALLCGPDLVRIVLQGTGTKWRNIQLFQPLEGQFQLGEFPATGRKGSRWLN